jgi:serine/threonine-protein kinase
MGGEAGGYDGGSYTGTVETKRRNPWTWPLVALIGILLVVLVGAIIALFTQPTSPTGPSDSPAVSAPETPSTSPSPSNLLIELTPGQFDGMTEAEVRDALQSLGLAADVSEGTPAETEDQVGTVYTFNPTGNVRKGETIFVKIYGPVPPPELPAQPGPLSASTPGPYAPGTDVTITWPTYNGCPSGSELSSFAIAIENGTVPPGTNPVAPGTNSATITVADNPGETKVSYTAACDGVASPASAVLTLTVQ